MYIYIKHPAVDKLYESGLLPDDVCSDVGSSATIPDRVKSNVAERHFYRSEVLYCEAGQ